MPSLPPAINLVSHVHGEGPLVVGLHDIGQSGSEMLEALAPLTDRFRVVCPDLRGHGESPTPHGPWSVDDFASDVARLVAAEGGGAIVVGTGLGAATGLSMALGHPGLISSLVVSGFGPRAEDADGQERWVRLARALRERGGPEGVALAAEAMSTRPDLRGALVQVQPPVRVIAGAADRATPPEEQRELAGWLRAARFQQVPGVGHDLTHERPGELVAAVERAAEAAYQQVAA